MNPILENSQNPLDSTSVSYDLINKDIQRLMHLLL